MHQRAEKARRGLTKLGHQITPAAGAFDGFSSVGEDTLDLFVQLVSIGDYGDPTIRVIFKNPFGQQHHHDAFPAALSVPDDAALLLADVLLASFGAKILM